MRECDSCHKKYPVIIQSIENLKRKRTESSIKKENEKRKKIEEEPNQNVKKMSEIIFDNNDSLKRDYERFMTYQHNFFMNVSFIYIKFRLKNFMIFTSKVLKNFTFK